MEISLYVHVPFCRQKCDYCDFFSIPLNRASCVCPDEKYVRSVLNEIRFYVKKYSVSRWKTVYIGGGTPSQLGAKLLFELVSGIKSAVSDKTADEFTVEMNPEDLAEDILDSAQKAGVDRISTGIQALDQKALDSVNRHCPLQTAISSLELLQKKWKKKLSVDFIAGLPGQTYSSFKKQFETVFNFKNIDHISLYSLTLEENTPLYKKIESGKIKWSQQKTDRMWILGRKILKENGFIQYEVSNFARTGAESLTGILKIILAVEAVRAAVFTARFQNGGQIPVLLKIMKISGLTLILNQKFRNRYVRLKKSICRPRNLNGL